MSEHFFLPSRSPLFLFFATFLARSFIHSQVLIVSLSRKDSSSWQDVFHKISKTFRRKNLKQTSSRVSAQEFWILSNGVITIYIQQFPCQSSLLNNNSHPHFHLSQDRVHHLNWIEKMDKRTTIILSILIATFSITWLRVSSLPYLESTSKHKVSFNIFPSLSFFLLLFSLSFFILHQFQSLDFQLKGFHSFRSYTTVHFFKHNLVSL